ncbi:translation initiation factor IF-6 [Candidatus Bathyarchaeota archaeon]|nr:translation initiation factor IF-6 [Candidatus Bathyarchaeota archaeon]
MPLFLLDIFGSASIGVFMRATDRFVIVPNQLPENTIKKIEKWFNVNVVKTNVSGSVLIGSLVCANSYGLILPHSVYDGEIAALKKTLTEVNITVMGDSKKTAFGNLVLANDRGAIVDPRLKKPEVKAISDTLGVEAVPSEIAGLPYVGSLAVATDKGVLAHPLIKPEEEKLLGEVLKAPINVGTINCGIPYVATGLIGNSNVAVAGSLTTGPELFMISQALKVVERHE